MVLDSGLEAPGSDSDPGHSHSHKKSLYLNQKKNQKQWNTETPKLDPGLHFQDCISETAFPGPQSRDHGNRDCISEITGIGTSF